MVRSKESWVSPDFGQNKFPIHWDMLQTLLSNRLRPGVLTLKITAVFSISLHIDVSLKMGLVNNYF